MATFPQPRSTPFEGTTPAAYTPGLTAHFMGGMTGQDDGSFEDYQRESGSYQPGQSEELSDQIERGSDDNAP